MSSAKPPDHSTASTHTEENDHGYGNDDANRRNSRFCADRAIDTNGRGGTVTRSGSAGLRVRYCLCKGGKAEDAPRKRIWRQHDDVA